MRARVRKLPRVTHYQPKRGVAQPGSALLLGSRSREFKSLRPDRQTSRQAGSRLRAVDMCGSSARNAKTKRTHTTSPMTMGEAYASAYVTA
jgi:hypothetical protein